MGVHWVGEWNGGRCSSWLLLCFLRREVRSGSEQSEREQEGGGTVRLPLSGSSCRPRGREGGACSCPCRLSVCLPFLLVSTNSVDSQARSGLPVSRRGLAAFPLLVRWFVGLVKPATSTRVPASTRRDGKRRFKQFLDCLVTTRQAPRSLLGCWRSLAEETRRQLMIWDWL